MAKRKRSKSPTKESALVHSRQQQPDLFILPEDILWGILHWSRPDDDDQSIWLWLCRVSGTCKVFRRLVRIEKKGGVPRSLLPTVFKLLPKNKDYLNEGPNQVRIGFDPSSDTAFLRVELMKTIRQSHWMASNLKCIHACDNCASYDETRSRNWAIAQELKNLVTSSYSPNLMELKITNLDFPTEFNLVDEGFLRDLAEQRLGLRTLFLIGFGTPGRGRLTPEAFGTFAASMHQLQKVALGLSGNDQAWFGDEHLRAFLNNLNPSVTSLALDFEDFHLPTNDGFGTIVSASCPNLQSLQIYSLAIRTRQLGNILRSKRSLAHVDLSHVYNEVIEFHDEGVMDAIVENQLRLQTFRAFCCRWFRDESLGRLVSFQIDTFGKILLQTLGIYGTKVTPAGLRAALTRWRETNPAGPVVVELFGHERGSHWQPLVAEFPEVEFTTAKYALYDSGAVYCI